MKMIITDVDIGPKYQKPLGPVKTRPRGCAGLPLFSVNFLWFLGWEGLRLSSCGSSW